MKCIVKSTTGQTITIDFNVETTVLELKKMVSDINGIPFDLFIMVYGGKELKNDCRLVDYGVAKNSSIQCVEKTVGGLII